MKFDPYSSKSRRPFVIAEIGINHNGDVSLARELIDMASDCGADAVKFQKRTIDVVYTKESLEIPRESPWGTTQREQKEGLEFGVEEYNQIDSHCREKRILWSASAWDPGAQEFLRRYDLPFNKVASALLTHPTMLEMIAEEGKHTFISTGMSDFADIDNAVQLFQDAGCACTLMHCVSTYPCRNSWCNIRMIETLSKRYGLPVGYSGHEAGISPSVLAIALGAVALERHITLDRSMYGSDQSASLERRGLEILVRDAREVEATLGTGERVMIPEEQEVANKLRYFRE